MKSLIINSLNTVQNNKLLFYKQFRLNLDLFISYLVLNNVIFFGFTINFVEYIDYKSLLIFNIDNEKIKLINLLKKIDLIEFIYISDEIYNQKKTVLNINKKNRIL